MQQSSVYCCHKNSDNKVIHFCSRRTLYWIFAFLRVLLNFVPQTGYIHPDEFFQFIEVGSGDSFDIDVYKPWEFNVTFPVRNSLIPQLCVRIPYLILESLNPQCEYYFSFSLKTPYFLVLFPRLTMTILSFISDYCLYKTCLIFREPYVDRLTFFASSYVMLVYSTRTFSNSVELVLTSILLYHVSRCIEFSNKVVLHSDYLADRYYKATTGVERTKFYKLRRLLPSHSLKNCWLLATLAVIGIFNRPTFVTFALPPIFFWLQRGLGSRSIGFLDFHIRIFTFILYGIPTVIGLILYDSFYFGYLTMAEIEKLEISMDNFVVTPLNFLRYNSVTDNLKNHGLHPRFLHFIVNVPLLFNILGIIGIITLIKMINSGLKGKWLELPRIQNIESMMMASFVIPIALLSIFPHQEPRFIIPVILPLVFLFSHWLKDPYVNAVNVANGKKTMPTKKKVQSKYGLLDIWYLCNIVFAIFYGFLHQGGVLSLTSHLSKEIKAKPFNTHIHYLSSYTYSLPTGLLHLRNTKKTYKSDSGHRYVLSKDFYLHEMGSKDIHSIFNRIIFTLQECEENSRTKQIPYRLYYALPFSLYDEFAEYASTNKTHPIQFSLVKSFYPHISVEKLPSIDILKRLEFRLLQNSITDLVENLYNNIVSYIKEFSLVLLRIEYVHDR